MDKYIKYFLYVCIVLAILYLLKKNEVKRKINGGNNEYQKIEPPHSHDYAYKRAYLSPVNNNNEACRANKNSTCISSCENYHYNFSKCVHDQPKYVPLSEEKPIGVESPTEIVIKELQFF